MKVDTVSDEDPESIKTAVQEALSEAVSDGAVGKLNVDPDSVSVEEPQVREEEKGNDKFMHSICLFIGVDTVCWHSKFEHMAE